MNQPKQQENYQLTQSDAEIQRSLGRIEGKLDSLANTLTEHTRDDHFNFEQLKAETAELKKIIYKSLGVIMFLGVSIPAAIAYFK